MKPTIQNLQDSFKIGYNNYKESREEAELAYEFYHNRQYTPEQIALLERRGQPKETYNVIAQFSRVFLGYLRQVIHEIKVTPRQQNDIYTAAVLNDLVSYTLQINNFAAEADAIKRDGILTGLMCVYEEVVKTGQTDQFGRPYFKIKLTHIPAQSLILDPHSRKADYSDAKFIHCYKWISEEDFVRNFGTQNLSKVEANSNSTGAPEADQTKIFKGSFDGKFKKFDNYLVVHSIVLDYSPTKGVISWSVFWCGDVILSKQELTYHKLRFPYRVQKINYSYKTEYYGLFREIIETQKAINQALIKIQALSNTKMIFVQKGSVEDIQEFKDSVQKVNGIVVVKDLTGLKFEDRQAQITEQYALIDKAVERIKAILAINDAFLGTTWASDSGRKTQIQQNASVVALNYLTTQIESFYRLLGGDVIKLIQQYFTATQTISIVDEYAGQKWIELNTPLMMRDENNQPILDENGNPKYFMEEVIDLRTGEHIEDPEGRLLIQPVPTSNSDIQFTEIDIKVESVAYNDEMVENQQLLEKLLNGVMGQFLLQTNPAGFARAASLALQNVKTKVSPELAQIFSDTANQLKQASQQPMPQAMGVEQDAPQNIPQNMGIGQIQQ